jgi:recombination protein RecA
MMDASATRFIPTGSLRLDLALGTGGLPGGHITEIFGPASSGKTTLCLHLLSEAQKLGGECAFIDIDGDLEPGYAQRCGVGPNQLYVTVPEHAEQALEIITTLACSGAMSLIVVDSISALISKGELNAPYGESRTDRSQDLISKALRRLRGPIRQNGTALVFTNRIKGVRRPIYHKLASNPARLALKLHSAVRLALEVKNLIQKEGSTAGQRITVEIRKNRFSPYHQPVELDIMYNDGIANTGDLLALGLQGGVIQQNGERYTFQERLIGADQEGATQWLKGDAALRAAIEKSIRQRYFPAATWHEESGEA